MDEFFLGPSLKKLHLNQTNLIYCILKVFMYWLHFYFICFHLLNWQVILPILGGHCWDWQNYRTPPLVSSLWHWGEKCSVIQRQLGTMWITVNRDGEHRKLAHRFTAGWTSREILPVEPPPPPCSMREYSVLIKKIQSVLWMATVLECVWVCVWVSSCGH